MKMTTLLTTMASDDVNVTFNETEQKVLMAMGAPVTDENEEIIDYEIDAEAFAELLEKLTVAKKMLKAEATKAKKETEKAEKAEKAEIGKKYWATLKNGDVVEYIGKDGNTYKVKRLIGATEAKAGLDGCSQGVAKWIDIPSFATYSKKDGSLNNARIMFDRVVVPQEFVDSLKDVA